MDEPLRDSLAPNAVQGWELRWLLTLMLRDHGEMTIPQMTARLHRAGFVTARRPSNAISDSLRLEIGKGRVRRVARGRYGFAGMPRSTASRFRANARRVHELRAFATERAIAPLGS